MKMIFKKTLASMFFIAAFMPKTSTSTEVFPQAALMPWHFIRISKELTSASSSLLNDSLKYLESKWLTSSKSLVDFSENKNLSNNAKILSKNIKVGKNRYKKKLLLEPIWCSINDQYLFFLQAADIEFDTLSASSHILIPKKIFTSNIKNNTQGFLTDKIKIVYKDLISKIQNSTSPQKGLKLALRLSKETTREDHGSSLCLNLLLEEKLSEKYIITRSIDGEMVGNMFFTLNKNIDFKRPNRTILLNWTQIKTQGEYKVNISFSESIFGNRIGKPYSAIYKLDNINNRIKLSLDNNLQNFLNNESRALDPSTAPSTVKIYGAWVYLDKGRAYGLQINDRLISKDLSGNIIKGHIVGFYGPGLHLSSKDFTINDGAILYIRKGQKLTRLGQTFSYDPTYYPTRWPPLSSKK